MAAAAAAVQAAPKTAEAALLLHPTPSQQAVDAIHASLAH